MSVIQASDVRLILPQKSALVTIDFQNFFCDFRVGAKYGLGLSLSERFDRSSGSPVHKRYKTAAQKTNALLPIFREAGVEIIHVRTSVDGLCEEGDDFYQIEPNVQTDKFARKTKPNAFLEDEGDDPLLMSDIHRHLQKFGISRVFFTGVHTDACVLNTVKGAIDNDYETFVIEDCTAERSLPQYRLSALAEMKEYGAEVINAQQACQALNQDI